jgi:hypothetical protein
MCGAPEQTQVLPPGTDLSKQTVLTGTVRADEEPLGGAYVRLLDATGEFTAEVVSQPPASSGFSPLRAPGRSAPCIDPVSAKQRSPPMPPACTPSP